MANLIRVFVLPPSLKTDGFLHGGGQPATFTQVDWFDDGPPEPSSLKVGTAEWRFALTEFLKLKRYYRSDRAFLVLHPEFSFTLNYEAPR